MIAELTGMDVANASIYDGGSSLAEACLMASSINGRTEIALAGGVNPLYRRVVETYVEGPGLRLREVPSPDGVVDLDAGRRVVGGKTAALVVQSPNFYGCLEDVAAAAELAHGAGALLVVVSDPVNLGVLEAPGRQGADIVVGEGQGRACRSRSAGPTWGCSPPRASSCAGCRAGWSAPPWTSTAPGGSPSPCRRASSTSAGPRRPRTSAPTSRCAR
jgi:glycine dehydrogenase subunit 1